MTANIIRYYLANPVLFVLLAFYLASTFYCSTCHGWRQTYSYSSKKDRFGLEQHNDKKGTDKNSTRSGVGDASSGRTLTNENRAELPPLQARIVGGYPAAYGEIPSQIYLLNNGNFHCGGTLVFVLEVLCFITAAHCVWRGEPLPQSPVTPDKVVVVGNDINILYETGHEVVRLTERLVVHEDFDPRFDFNDIAIIFPQRPIYESKGINYMNLPEKGWDVPNFVQISGWGTLLWGGQSSHDLQKAVIPSMDYDGCQIAAQGYIITPNQFCMGPAGLAILGSCQGDSGGPVLAFNESLGYQYLAGIISYGSTMMCGDPYGVTMVTKVTNYIDWIHKHVQEYRDIYGTTAEQKWEELQHNITQG